MFTFCLFLSAVCLHFVSSLSIFCQQFVYNFISCLSTFCQLFVYNFFRSVSSALCQLFVYTFVSCLFKFLWNICLHFFRWQLKFFIQTKKHHGKERLKFTKQLYWDMKIFWDLLQQTSEVNIWFSWHFFKISISRVFLFNCSGTGNGSQRLIITDYHQNGSLHDFLKENIIDQNDLVSLNFFFKLCRIFFVKSIFYLIFFREI